jgi:hypothetical protein
MIVDLTLVEFHAREPLRLVNVNDRNRKRKRALRKHERFSALLVIRSNTLTFELARIRCGVVFMRAA